MLLYTLGKLELSPSDFRRPKPLLLLAYLALEGPQERGHLAELFFKGSKKARANLSVALSRLRQATPDAIASDDVRVGTSVAFDARQLIEAFEQSEWEKGIELYKGRFLTGFDTSELGTELEEWLYGTREFLAGQVQRAQVKQAEKEAARGHYKDAADWAARAYQLADTMPAPDSLRRIHTLLLAGASLYASEVKRELEGFNLNYCLSQEEAREHLHEVLGVVESSVPNNLPLRGTSFVGRDLELAEVTQKLKEHRLLTLLGPGGVGKSRLALQVAQQQLNGAWFEQGIYFVALDALASADAIPTSLAAVLGCHLKVSEDALLQIARYLGEKRVLLVLDNFEHVIEGAGLVSKLLHSCPFLRVLVTSRERLNLEEEWRFEVGGLACPVEANLNAEEARHFASIQLFLQRASQAKPDFALNDDVLAPIIMLCRLVEGLPLALELTATWVRVMRCEELVEAIGQNLDLLTTPNRDTPDKHRSIRASFEYSWQRLSKKERTVMKKLAVFRGGFRREAASAVAGATLPVLATLVDKSLLRVSATGRYDRHPLLYQYTQEKLAGQPGAQQIVNAHACYFLEFVEDVVPHLTRHDQAYWLRRLAEEHDNIRTALTTLLEQQDANGSLRLAIAASQYWHKSGYFEQTYSFLIKSLTFQEADKALRARAYMRAGTIKFQQREMKEAWRLFENGLELSRELGDERGLSAGLNNLGNLAAGRGDYARARPLLEESLVLRRELDLKGAVAWSLFHLSGVERAEGYFEKSKESLEEAVKLLRHEGDTFSEAWILDGFGWHEKALGNYSAAEAYFEQALKLRHEINDISSKGHSYFNLGLLARAQDDSEKAQQYFRDSLKWNRELGVKPDMAAALFQLGDLALSQTDFSEARACFEECFALRHELNDLEGVVEILKIYVQVAVQQREYERGTVLWSVAEKIAGQGKTLEDDPRLKVLKQNLSEDVFTKAWQQGQAIKFENTIALTLGGRESRV